MSNSTDEVTVNHNLLKIANRVLKIGGRVLRGVDPNNPYNLPPYTLRLRFVEGYVPEGVGGQVDVVLVDAQRNIWDLIYATNQVSYAPFVAQNENLLLEIVGANVTGVSRMSQMFPNNKSLTKSCQFDSSSATTTQAMFDYCYALEAAPKLELSNVSRAESMFRFCRAMTYAPDMDLRNNYRFDSMFYGCWNLKEIPDIQINPNISSRWNVSNMCAQCYKAETGILRLYNKLKEVPMLQGDGNKLWRQGCFSDCGRETESGRAELAQIPSDWGGTGA